MTLARPAIDPELQGLLAALPTMPQLSPEVVEQVRRFPQPPIETVLDGRDVDRSEITVTSSDGAQIPLSIYAARIWAGRRAGGAARLGGRLPRLRRALPAGARVGGCPPYAR